MPIFCSKCGTQAASNEVKFCSKCGAPLQAPAPEPAQQAATPPPPPAQQAAAPKAAQAPAAAPPAAAKGSSGWMKVVIGIVGFFVIVGALGLGTCIFVGYKAKQKIEQAKAEYGLGDNGPAAQARDVCSLVTKEEVSQFTGVAITRAEGSTSKCTYSSATNPVVLETDVDWSGGKLGLKMGVASLKAMGGKDTVIEVGGIGDEAYTISLKGKPAADLQAQAEKDDTGIAKGIAHLMAESPLMFSKGDVMGTVRLTQAEDPETAKRAIGRVMASRL